MAAGSNDSERGFFLQPRLEQVILKPLPRNQIYEQEQKLAELRRSKGPFDRAVRALTTNIREGYETLILENLPSSESIEQQLWRLHYSFIEEFRARLGKLKAAALAAVNVPNKKKAVEQQKFERVGGQYKCFLDEATGFYHGLIAKLGAKHGLSGKLSSSSNISEISSSNERFRRCQCVCHRCYIYLGDLARYKELHLVVEGRTADWYVAANYYRQASALWPAGGNPHNQLGVLATYAGDNLQALYHYLYSLAVPAPFTTARANAKLLFEKNQHHNSQLSNSPEEDMAIDIQMAQPFESHATKSSTESHRECPLARLQKRFRVHFITLIGFIFNKTGLEEVSELTTPVLREAQLLLSQDNMLITSSFTLEKSNPFNNQAFSVMQLVVLLILSIHNVGPKKDKSSRNSDGLETSPFVMQAIIFAFQFMTVVLQHCTRAEEPCCSHLFPAVVVFCNWLASYPDFIQQIQGDKECDKLQCSFAKEACMLLSKCLRQVGMAKNHDNDSIAYSEKEGHHGTETVLWEDKELYGIVPLKYLEASEFTMKSTVLAKSGQNVAESACVVRVERLLKALTFLSSLFKLDSPELDAAVSKASFGWTSMRATPSERITSQSSGGSVRTADGGLELNTQGPCIVQRGFEISLSSHCRKENRIFLKARDQNVESVGPPKPTRHPPEVSLQHKDITGGELNPCNMSQGTALPQPEGELCDNSLETIPEDPVRSNLEHKEDGALCSAGRGALSLGDWVKAPAVCNDDNVDRSPALKKKRTHSRSGATAASEQAQTHSSAEESFVPSLSFKPVCGTPKPPRAPSCSNSAQPEVGEPIEKQQHIAFPEVVCKDIDTHTGQGSAQDPIDLDCEETTKMEKAVIKHGDGNPSQSRKRKFVPYSEPSKGPSPDVVMYDVNIATEAVCQDVVGMKKGDDDNAEPDKQSPLTTSMEDVPSIVHVASEQELNTLPQVIPCQSVQIFPDHMVAESTERQDHEPIATGCSKSAIHEDNQDFPSLLKTSVEIPKNSLEDRNDEGRGKKRKHDFTTPLPSSRCQNCKGTSPGEGTSQRVNLSTPQSRIKNNLDAGFSRQWRYGSCRACKDPHPSTPYYSPSDLDGRTYWLSAPCKRRRMKEWEREEDFSWLDTYTHVVPQALTQLAAAINASSFSFSDFGIFGEFGASANGAKNNLGLGQPK